MAGDRAGALAHINDDEILARIKAGEHASRIAQELGVHKSAISHRYQGKPEYLQAREQGAEVRLEEAEMQIIEASDPFNLARAREAFRAVAWRCEREFPNRWGQRTQVSVTVGLSDELQRIAERKRKQLEGQVIHSAAPQLTQGNTEITDAEYVSTPGEQP